MFEERLAHIIAAVLGAGFDPKLLRIICSEPRAYESSLELLHPADLLVEAPRASGVPSLDMPEQQYRFTHTLVQEVVYQNLPVRRRMELHGHAGHALETLCAEQPQRLYERALTTLVERALAQAERLAVSVDDPPASHDPETRQEIAAAISHACNTLGVALARIGRLDEAVAYIERSGTVAQTAELFQVACRSTDRW